MPGTASWACRGAASVLRRQRAGKLAQGLLVLFVLDLREVAGQLQAHPLPRADRLGALVVEPFEEIADGNADDAGDLEKTPRRDAVDPTFVFMRLLIGHADEVRQLLLRQTEHDPALTDPRADMMVDVLGSIGRSLHLSLIRLVWKIRRGRPVKR